jgi:hypothetical protein
MFKRILLSLGLITSLLLAPPPASADTAIGGLVKTDLVLRKDGSPYLLTSTLQIPSGRTVTVEPGVEIRANGVGTMFWNQGNLLFNGNRATPIRLTGKPNLFVSGKNSPNGSNLKISGVFFEGGDTLLSHEGYGGYQSIVFEDSEVKDVTNYIDIWYPPNNLIIERNVFTNSGGFSVGFRYSPNLTSVSILNNLFIGPSTTNFWIQVWASYDGQLEVHGNEFRGSNYTALRLAPNSGDTKLSATGNYWGNRSPEDIGKMILDSNDSLEYQNIIDISSPLVSPSNLVPKDSILIAEAKVAAELKAKQEAEVKAAVELKAKQDAEAKAAELRAKEEAEAKAAAEKVAAEKAAAELKAKQEADAKAQAEKEAFIKLQVDLAAANASLADSQKVNRDLRAQLTAIEGQFLALSDSVSTIQTEVLALNTKLTTALKSLNTANAKIKKICAIKPKPKGC